MNPVSRLHPLKHYIWGEQCDGWNLVDNSDLSVKMERMPPHTAEQDHFHQHARQFFFILKGRAVIFLASGKMENLPACEKQEAQDFQRTELKEQEGLEIGPGLIHRIANESEEDLEFILCSQPSAEGDRTNIS